MWWDERVSGNPLRSYRPGTWFGLLGERALVALPPSEKARVAALWELVDEGAGFDITLDALISGGLRALPGFVLVSTDEDRTDVVIRGAATATFTVGDEEVVVEGSSATTWVERSLESVERMRIELESVGDDEESGAPYVVDGGLFRVSRIDETRVPGEPGRPPRALHVVESPDTDGVVALAAVAGIAALETDEPDAEDLDAGEEAPIWEPVDDTDDAAEVVVVRSPEPPAWTPAPPDDHDGLTLAGAPLPPPPPPPGIPGQEPAPDVTKVVARLVISSGQTVDVDRVTVIGRAPESKQFSQSDPPRLVTVPSAHYEISSAHLEIRPGTGSDHGSAVVTDLGSTNGTVVVQPGLGPQDLAPGEAVQLLPGSLIDIGDGITIQVTRP
jgi:FHA domain